MTPAELAVQAGPDDIPYLREHPGPALFARRAARFFALAEHREEDSFIAFCGRLAGAQAVAAETLAVDSPPIELASVRPVASMAQHDDEWLEALRMIVTLLEHAPMPQAARRTLQRLAHLPQAEVTALSRLLLTGQWSGLDLALCSFVAAALQVQFAGAAARIPRERVERVDGDCPMCGWPPVAGFVLGKGLRYLACAMCGVEWYLPRVTCAFCGTTEGISFYSQQGDSGGAKAEVCDECQKYLKVFYLARRPSAEPAADDVATLALDVLVSAKGYGKAGINLYLLT